MMVSIVQQDLCSRALLTHVGRTRCLELMAEDPARQQRRTCLQKEREKMVTAQQELESLHRPDVAMVDDVDPWNQER